MRESRFAGAFVTALVVGLGALAASGCGGGSSHSNVFFVSTSSISGTRSIASVGSGQGGTVTLAADGTAQARITVTLLDGNGNPVAGALVTATASGTGNGISVSGPTSSAGVATVLVSSGTPQTETITIAGATGSPPVSTTLASSITLTFVPVAASGSTIAASPASVVADGTTAVSVSVTVRDASGNPVAGAPVSFAATSGSNVKLSPSSPVPTDATGVARVSVTSTTAQSGVVVAATVAQLAGVGAASLVLDSPQLSFTAGAASSIAFSTQPSNVQAGDIAGPFMSPAPTVSILDANGNVVPTSSNMVAIHLVQGGLDLGLAGLSAAETVNGVATFRYVSVSKAGTYSLQARATIGGVVTTVTSSSFTVTAGPQAVAPGGLAVSRVDNLVVTPLGATVAMVTTVTLVDRFGNAVPTAGTTVTLALTGGNTASLALSGTLTAMTNAQGVAVFSTIAAAGLTASAGTPPTLPSAIRLDATTGSGATLRTATSNAFFVTDTAAAAGTNATSVVVPGTIAAQTVTAVSGQATTLSAQELDSLGGGVSGDTVTFLATAAPISSVTGTLGKATGTTTATTNSAGTATFSITFDVAGTYTVSYTVSSATLGTTQAYTTITVVPGAASQLVFQDKGVLGPKTEPHTGQPHDAALGGNLGTVQVLVTDAASNVVTTATNAVTLALFKAPAGFALQGAPGAGVAAVNGVATFNGLSVSDSSTLTGRQVLGLFASSGGGALTGLSNSFVVAPPITQMGVVNDATASVKLVVTRQPPAAFLSDGTGLDVTFALLDSGGNVVTGDSTTVVDVAFVSSRGTVGHTSVTAVNGTVSRPTPFITGAGTGQFFVASAPGINGAITQAFDIVPNLTFSLVYLGVPTPAQTQTGTVIGSTQPSPAGAPATGVSPGSIFRIAVVDVDNDILTGDTTPVTVDIDPTTAALATLSGTTTVTPVGGLASFGNLTLTLVPPNTTATVILVFTAPGCVPTQYSITVTQ